MARAAVAVLGLALLVGCMAPQDSATRASDVPLYAMATLNLDEFSGTWTVYEVAEGTTPVQRVEVANDAHGVTFTLDGDTSVMRQTGAAQFRDPNGRSYWVLWVDAGYRTAVIGSPDAPVGWIMDRGAPSTDRLKAARKILKTSGYRTQSDKENRI